MNYTQSEEYLFNTMPVGRAIASLAVPTVISQIITVIYNMADTFFVGQLGDPNQVAAATVALPLFIFITALANLFGVGGASLISRCLGQGDRQKAGHTAAFCIWSAIAVSLIYGIAVLLLRPVLLPLLGADAETFSYSSSYMLYSIGLGAMPAALNPMLAHLVRAEGHSRQASLGVAFGGILNILLDPLFIFVFRMGVKGAALATILSQAVSAVWVVGFLCSGRSGLHIRREHLGFRPRVMGKIAPLGVAPFIMQSTESLVTVVLNTGMQTYGGDLYVGSITIIQSIMQMIVMPTQGITQGVQPIMSYNYGAKNYARVRAVFRRLLAVTMTVTTAAFLLVALFPTAVALMFNDDPQLVTLVGDRKSVV